MCAETYRIQEQILFEALQVLHEPIAQVLVVNHMWRGRESEHEDRQTARMGVRFDLRQEHGGEEKRTKSNI